MLWRRLCALSRKDVPWLGQPLSMVYLDQLFKTELVVGVLHGTKPGPVPYLNQEEEKDLVDFLEVVSSVGYGKTRKQVKSLVERTAREKGVLKKTKLTDGWFRRFL